MKKQIILFFFLLTCFFATVINLIANNKIVFTFDGGSYFNFFITASSNKQFTINWGDASEIETKTGTGNPESFWHYYENSDNYTVVITGTTMDCFFTRFDSYNEQSSTQLTNLDLSHCAALISLNCTGNKLSTLDLSNNVNLEYLSCSGNQLSTLDLCINIALKVLRCADNQLTYLDLSNNTALVSLNCEDNQLSNLILSNCTSLNYLYCSNNLLTTLDISNKKDLKELYCLNNQLKELNITNNTLLKSLACSNNHLSVLDLINNPSLEHLNCEDNQLSDLYLNNKMDLRVLYCSSNLLQALDISDCMLLYYLYCSDNLLTTLDVSNNWYLNELICNGNRLNTLKLGTKPGLQWFNCSNNQLSNLDLSKCTFLNWINICNNQLPLSELFLASKMINYPLSIELGTQRLPKKKIEVEAFVDYSSQIKFDGIYSVFVVEKNGSLALPSDFSIDNGFITFHNIGNYIVNMKNSAIISNPDYPAEVIAEINVGLVGISEMAQQSNLKLFPNPVTNILNIETFNSNKIPETKIYSIQGTLLLNTKGNQIEVSFLPRGIYIAEIDGTCRKFVKQ